MQKVEMKRMQKVEMKRMRKLEKKMHNRGKRMQNLEIKMQRFGNTAVKRRYYSGLPDLKQ